MMIIIYTLLMIMMITMNIQLQQLKLKQTNNMSQLGAAPQELIPKIREELPELVDVYAAEVALHSMIKNQQITHTQT